jgi:hypothetical protein
LKNARERLHNSCTGFASQTGFTLKQFYITDRLQFDMRKEAGEAFAKGVHLSKAEQWLPSGGDFVHRTKS